jgi:PKD repeat protein
MFLAAPLAAGAVSIEDLQNQVASLLKQINAMQGQTQVSTSVSGSASVSSPVQYRVCNLLNRNLSMGARGDDVSGLQEFLQGQGYLSVNPTGYFGALTSRAVAQWQSSQGVSAIGSFGPLSRGKLMSWCGGGNTSSSNLQASVTSGNAPLAVDFTTSGNIVDDGFYSVNFGDGQTSNMTKGSCVGIAAIQGGQGGIRCSYNVSHTYTSDGTYTAQLNYGGCGSSACDAAIRPRTVGSVTITVGTNSSQGSLQADPQSGAAPLSTNFTFHPTSENGTYHIDYGDGSSEQMTTQQIYCIRAPCISPAVSSHTYSSAGTYDVVVSPYIACMYSNPRCMIAVMPLAKTSVTVTGSGSTCKPVTYMPILCPNGQAAQPQHDQNGCITGYQCTSSTGNQPPVISGISGPTTLAIGAAGTWSVQASDPENGSLNYSITWGDENAYAPTSAAMGANASFMQNSTFTHSYSSAGTYTVSVTVRDASGQSAQASTNVQVGSAVACTMEYAPVCGQMPAPTCPAGSMCPMYMPAPKTYSNRCMMNAAGANFLYSGACTNGN